MAQLLMRFHSHSLDRQTRLVSIAIAIGIGVLFTVAVCLEPNAKGHGTHEQLGLPACQFLRLTGWKCPQCGMTTSFAHTVRGQLFTAWDSNPCGPILAIILATVVFPWCVIAGLTGRSHVTREPSLTMIWMTGIYLLTATGVWLIRLAVL
jgi:hypothetical protein